MNQKPDQPNRFVFSVIVVVLLTLAAAALMFFASRLAYAQTILPSGSDLQSALNAAPCGSTILLQSGGVYKPQGDSFTLTKSCTSFITIQTAGTLPNGRLNPSTTPLAKLINSSGYPVIITAPGARGYRFIGIEITTAGTIYTPDLVNLGAYFTREQRLDTGHFVFDRVFIHPAELSATNLFPSVVERSAGRGMALGVTDVQVTNSYIAGFAGRYPATNSNAGQNIDSYGIYSDAGPGPIRLINNYIEAQFNNVFIGGAGMTTTNNATLSNATLTSATFSQVANLAVGDLVALQTPACNVKWQTGKVTGIAGTTVSYSMVRAQYSCAPSVPEGIARWNGDHIRDIEIRGNTLNKPDVWNAFSNPKAWIEIKEAKGWIVDGNDMYSGVGTSIALTVRNQDAASPWGVIQDGVFSNNRMRGYKDGMILLLSDNEQPTVGSGNITIRNSLWLDPKPATPDSPAKFIQLQSGFNVTIDHCTIVQPGVPMVSDTLVTGVKFLNSIVASYQYNMQCTLGNVPARCWPDLDMRGNIVIDTRWNKGDGPIQNLYPAGNHFANDVAGVGFSPDFSLSATSPYRNKGTDGKNPGVDMVELLAALGGSAPLPTPTPTPQPSPSPSPSPTATPTPVPTPTLEKYSYLTKTWPSTVAGKEALLTQMGGQGYRLIQVTGTTAIFEKKQ